MEMLKAKFKFFCIEYTYNRSIDREYRKQKLLQELNESEHKLATEPKNGELQRKTLQLKQDLELQEIKQYKERKSDPELHGLKTEGKTFPLVRKTSK